MVGVGAVINRPEKPLREYRFSVFLTINKMTSHGFTPWEDYLFTVTGAMEGSDAETRITVGGRQEVNEERN